jgi:glycosyltransferase involved in cell wall biosynthesis
MSQVPIVSVFMITYNHEKFIAQAIDSVLMQKTDFPYKIYLGEDCSTDKTRAICLEYKKNYPNKIELYLTDKNDIIKNIKTIYNACFKSGAKYVAMLEGDDYWTDPLKLQKQVDYLESNSDVVICFHNSMHLSEIEQNKKQVVRYNNLRQVTEDGQELTIEPKMGLVKYVLERNVATTASIMFRNNKIQLPDWYFTVQLGDWALQILLLEKGGYIGYIDEAMCIHRAHAGGIHSSKTITNKLISHIDLWIKLKAHFNGRYNKVLNRQIALFSKRVVYNAEVEKRFDIMRKYLTIYVFAERNSQPQTILMIIKSFAIAYFAPIRIFRKSIDN